MTLTPPPNNLKAGADTATKAAHLIMFCCVALSKSPNFLTISVKSLISGIIAGTKSLPILIAKTWSDSLKRSTLALAVLFIVSAIFLVEPVACSVLVVKSCKASPPWLTKAFIPACASVPKAMAMAAALCSLVQPAVLFFI